MAERSASDQGSLPLPLWQVAQPTRGLEKPPKALGEHHGESPPCHEPRLAEPAWQSRPGRASPGRAPPGRAPHHGELGAQPQEAPSSAPSY